MSYRTNTYSSKKQKLESHPKLLKQCHILYIQMQYCSEKTLQDFLASQELRCAKNFDEINFPRALTYFYQIAQGLTHVHSRKLIHRDLKPSNCFIDKDNTVKIGDFGLSREVVTVKKDDKDVDVDTFESEGGVIHNTSKVGTYLYASPEQSKGSNYTESTDIYSLGIIFFELCYPMYTVSLSL